MNYLDILKGFRTINLSSTIGYSSPYWGKSNYEGITSTFVLTDTCNMRCSYCYILEKPEGHVMPWEVAKKYVDYIFDLAKNYDGIDNPIPFTHGKIWDFVGGEPLLEYKLMFKIMDYINDKVSLLSKNHPWKRGFEVEGRGHVDGYRFSLSTNGVLLNNPEIRREFEIRGGNKKISLGISIDGPKEIHDLCRKTKEGNGTFDSIINVWDWYRKWFPGNAYSTKATISHENLSMINTVAKFFFEELKMKEVYINTVFENVWHKGDDISFFNQLCELADWLMENDRYKKYYISFFSDQILLKKERGSSSWCGAGKSMDACGYDGKIYPCLRFKTLYNKDPLVIGDVWKGKDFEIVDKFSSKTCDNMSDKTLELTGNDCLNCEVSNQCADCQGYSYDCLGDFFTKVTYICPMHKARVCANIYFYGRILGIIDPSDKPTLLGLLEELNENSRHHMK